MKTIVMIVIMLTIVLAFCFCVEIYIDNSGKEFLNEIEHIQNNVGSINSIEGDEVENNFNKTKSAWEEKQKIWSMFIEHFEIDEINSSFIRAKVFLDEKDKTNFLVEITELKRYFEHIPKTQQLLLYNII